MKGRPGPTRRPATDHSGRSAAESHFPSSQAHPRSSVFAPASHKHELAAAAPTQVLVNDGGQPLLLQRVEAFAKHVAVDALLLAWAPISMHNGSFKYKGSSGGGWRWGWVQAGHTARRRPSASGATAARVRCAAPGLPAGCAAPLQAPAHSKCPGHAKNAQCCTAHLEYKLVLRLAVHHHGNLNVGAPQVRSAACRQKRSGRVRGAAERGRAGGVISRSAGRGAGVGWRRGKHWALAACRGTKYQAAGGGSSSGGKQQWQPAAAAAARRSSSKRRHPPDTSFACRPESSHSAPPLRANASCCSMAQDFRLITSRSLQQNA